MYLLTAAEIEGALNAQGCTDVDEDSIEKFKVILGLTLPRLEGAINVKTIKYGIYTDDFFIGNPTQQTRLRLSNAFLHEPATLSLSGVDHSTYEPFSIPQNAMRFVEREMGIINCGRLNSGIYRCTYVSGFRTDEKGFFLDLPPWLVALAQRLVVQWYRTGLLAVRVPENIALRDLTGGIQREVSTSLYNSFDRPRDAVFSQAFNNGY